MTDETLGATKLHLHETCRDAYVFTPEDLRRLVAEIRESEKQIEYWRQLFLVEHDKRLAVENAYDLLNEARRSERPEKQLAPDWETERCQP